MTTNRLYDRWRSGGVAVGGWCTTGSSLVAELLAEAGFDYVCADCQHGLMGYDGMVPVLQAIARSSAAPIVRVAWNSPGDIAKALDAGAEAIIVPMVNTRTEAEQAVAACRYPPMGFRSFGPVRSSLFLGSDPPFVNSQVACLVMIETVFAVERADEICATPGLDGVYLGPADLAVSMGLPPYPDKPSRAPLRRHRGRPAGLPEGGHCGWHSHLESGAGCRLPGPGLHHDDNSDRRCSPPAGGLIRVSNRAGLSILREPRGRCLKLRL